MFNFIENLSFKIQCKECEHCIYSEDYGIIESLVDITRHIEKFEHTKFELEIYDFDLAFVKEIIDIVKICRKYHSIFIGTGNLVIEDRPKWQYGLIKEYLFQF